MATPKNWINAVNAAGQWNTLVSDAGAILSAVLVSNTGETPINIQMRIATTAGVAITTLLAPHELSGYGSDVLNLRSLVLSPGQQLQLYTDTLGVQSVTTGAL